MEVVVVVVVDVMVVVSDVDVSSRPSECQTRVGKITELLLIRWVAGVLLEFSSGRPISPSAPMSNTGLKIILGMSSISSSMSPLPSSPRA